MLWNSNAQQAIYEVARQAPYVAPRSFAMVHGAIYDAVNAIAGTPYEPYLVAPGAHRGDSPDAAVATAAHHVLLSLFPAQADSLDRMYADALAPIPAGRAKDGGIRVGARADPTWTPLLVTPPFPDYTSGHTCSTSTIMSTMRAFFGRDDIPFSAYSADANATRSFPSFSAALAEVVEARVWGGVHYRSADVQGVEVGNGVAKYVLTHEFRPRR